MSLDHKTRLNLKRRKMNLSGKKSFYGQIKVISFLNIWFEWLHHTDKVKMRFKRREVVEKYLVVVLFSIEQESGHATHKKNIRSGVIHKTVKYIWSFEIPQTTVCLTSICKVKKKSKTQWWLKEAKKSMSVFKARCNKAKYWYFCL